MAVYYKVDGTQEEIALMQSNAGGLAQMQQLVGGFIQMVPIDGGTRTLICNEEGLLEGLPINHLITPLVRGQVLMDGGIRGNALIATQAELGALEDDE